MKFKLSTVTISVSMALAFSFLTFFSEAKNNDEKHCLYTNKMGNHTCFSPSQRNQYNLSSKKCQSFYDTEKDCIKAMSPL